MPKTTPSATFLVEDYNIRKFLKKKLYAAGVPQIEIERNSQAGQDHHPLRPPRHRHRARAAPRSKSSGSSCEKMINKNVNISIV